MQYHVLKDFPTICLSLSVELLPPLQFWAYGGGLLVGLGLIWLMLD